MFQKAICTAKNYTGVKSTDKNHLLTRCSSIYNTTLTIHCPTCSKHFGKTTFWSHHLQCHSMILNLTQATKLTLTSWLWSSVAHQTWAIYFHTENWIKSTVPQCFCLQLDTRGNHVVVVPDTIFHSFFKTTCCHTFMETHFGDYSNHCPWIDPMLTSA